MIIKIQSLIFLTIGVLCWNGIDDAFQAARDEAHLEILIKFPLELLVEMDVRDI